MIGKTPKEHQMSIFEVALESFIDMNHELVLLSKQIDWEAVESEFTEPIITLMWANELFDPNRPDTYLEIV